MDANERLAFINRLNGLSGGQAKEVLKQITINCNTRQTTIARALRNAVDQHAPHTVQYVVPVAAQSSPYTSIATPSTVASTFQRKVNVHDEGNASDNDSLSSSTSDSESSDSDKSIVMNSDRRKLLQTSVSSRWAPNNLDQRQAPSPPENATKKNAAEIKKAAVPNQADSIKKRKIWEGQGSSAARRSSSIVSRGKRKADEHGETGYNKAGKRGQENKKAKTSQSPRYMSDLTCRKCLEVFSSKDVLYEHLSEIHLVPRYLPRKHHEAVAAIPVIHASAPSPDARRRPGPATSSQSARHHTELGSQQRAAQHVKVGIKQEPGGEAADSPSISAHKNKTAREKTMPPPAFVRQPNNFPRGPTPAPMVIARKR